MSGPWTCKRIRKHLLKKRPAEFTAGDIAKDLSLTSQEVAAHLKNIPEVQIKDHRKYAHSESGNRYHLVMEISP